MKTVNLVTKFVVCSALTLGGPSCAANDSVGASSLGVAGQAVEVFSWWTSGGEADALNAGIAVYKDQYANGSVVKSSIQGSTSAKDQLRARIAQGAPPDVFQANGGLDLCSWVTASAAYAENMDDLAQQAGWTNLAVMPQAVQDSARCTGPDKRSHFYGVPIDIHRDNTLFYNKKLLAAAGIATPPTSIEEFFTAADRIKATNPNVAPLALGTNPAKGGPWTLNLLMFESLLPGMQGAQWYLKFYQGRADLSTPTTDDSLKLRAVLEASARLLDYVNADFLDLGWDGAAELLRADKAAMMVMGDWANGTYIKDGWSAGTDDGFGGRAAFGDAFVMTTDTFALATGARARASAVNFLSVFASAAAQDAFNRIKGSIPPRIAQLDPTVYNAYAQGAAADFAAAGQRLVPALSLMAPSSYADAINAQLASFELDRDVDDLMLTIRNNYDTLVGQ